MTFRRSLHALLISLLAGTLLATSCGDIVVDSVKTGVFTFISGSVSNTFGSSQLNDLIDSLLRGGSSNNNDSRIGV